MPLIEYKNFNFRKRTVEIINMSNGIIEEYQADEYELTLRQLYYQFVARDLFPEDRRWKWTGTRWVKDPKGTKNAPPNYKWLEFIINNGRLAGLIDWNAIIDRTRDIKGNAHWESPKEIIKTCASQFKIDTRIDQDTYIEVWVEKDALIGVLERACTGLDVRYFSCRGYVSQSAMWRAAQRFIEQIDRTYYEREMMGDREAVLLHLGDHDPSGIDMTRDIQDRLDMFGTQVRVERIALSMEQIKEHKPPPNPAKTTDSRYKGYIDEYGDESWELDALDPRIITELIEVTVRQYTDFDKRTALIEKEREHKSKLGYLAKNWDKLSNKF